MKSAIVGLGAIAPTHFDAITRAGGEVVAVCDTDAGQAERFFAKTGCKAPLFPTLSEMLSHGGFDVLHICTPHYLHAEMVIKGLTAGYHVLCEKPLCICEEDIPRILEAEAESGKRLGVCLQNRYNAANLEARRLSEGARAGLGTVVWERGAGYYASGAWRGKWETEGGGSLINQALHTLDLTMWFCGDPDAVLSVSHNLTMQKEIEVEDTIFARFEGEQPFTVLGTNVAMADLPVEIGIHLDDHTQLTVLPSTFLINGVPVPSATVKKKAYGKDCYGSGHATLIEDFYDCVATGRHFPIDGREGARVIRLILAAYKSRGERVEIN